MRDEVLAKAEMEEVLEIWGFFRDHPERVAEAANIPLSLFVQRLLEHYRIYHG